MAESPPVNTESPQALIAAAVQEAKQSTAQPSGQDRDALGRFTPGSDADAAGAQEPQPVTGEVFVQLDGVTRKVNIDDLVRRATTADRVVAEAEAVKRTAAEQLAQNASTRRLAEIYGQLTPEQQHRVTQLISQQANPQPQADDPFGFAPAQQTTDPRLNDLERVVRAQNEMLVAIGNERRGAQINQTVETEMAALPIFGSVAPALREMAKESVMRAIQAQGAQADIAGAVLEVAKRTQAVHRETSSRQIPGFVPGPAQMGQGQVAPRMSGAELTRGQGPAKVREALAKLGIPDF